MWWCINKTNCQWITCLLLSSLISFAHVTVLQKTWLLEVYITKLELLKALHGGHQTDEAVLMASSKTISTQTFEKVLTQTKVLKRPIGSAHKGWQLDGSVNAEGLCAFLHGKSSKFKLTLTRRILRQTYLDSLGCAWRSQIHGCLKNQDQGPRLTES